MHAVCIRVAPDLIFQIRPEPETDLAETCFRVTEQYAHDKTNGVNNAVSCYRGSTVSASFVVLLFASL